jgi:hypothetical protein
MSTDPEVLRERIQSVLREQQHLYQGVAGAAGMPAGDLAALLRQPENEVTAELEKMWLAGLAWRVTSPSGIGWGAKNKTGRTVPGRGQLHRNSEQETRSS